MAFSRGLLSVAFAHLVATAAAECTAGSLGCPSHDDQEVAMMEVSMLQAKMKDTSPDDTRKAEATDMKAEVTEKGAVATSSEEVPSEDADEVVDPTPSKMEYDGKQEVDVNATEDGEALLQMSNVAEGETSGCTTVSGQHMRYLGRDGNCYDCKDTRGNLWRYEFRGKCYNCKSRSGWYYPYKGTDGYCYSCKGTNGRLYTNDCGNYCSMGSCR